MNAQEQIQIIESKITEIKSTLETWTTQITNYHTALFQIAAQLNEIKKQLQ